MENGKREKGLWRDMADGSRKKQTIWQHLCLFEWPRLCHLSHTAFVFSLYVGVIFDMKILYAYIRQFHLR